MKRQAVPSPRRGTIVVIVMVMLLVAMSIAIAVLQAATFDARQFVTERRALQADRLAEAGLARGMLRMNDESDQSEDWQIELPDGTTATVSIRSQQNDGRRTIEAVATYPADAERPVRSRRSAIAQQTAP